MVSIQLITVRLIPGRAVLDPSISIQAQLCIFGGIPSGLNGFYRLH